MVEVTDIITIMGIDNYSRTRKMICLGLALFTLHDTRLYEEFCRFSGLYMIQGCVQQFSN